MSFLRSVFRVLMLAIVGTVIGVLLVEVIARSAPRLMPGPLQMLNHAFQAEVNWPKTTAADSYLGYHIRANQEITEDLEGHVIRSHVLALDSSEIGIRDMGTPIMPVDGVAIGDSFTYCSTVPVEKCWLHLVTQETGRRFVNLGVPGYSAIQETRMLERYGLPLHPRLILSGIFLNDFKEDVRFTRWLKSGHDSFLDWVREQRLNPWEDFLERKSLVYRIVRRGLIARGRNIRRWRGNGGELRLSGDGWWRSIVNISEGDRAWKLMHDTLLEQKRLANQSGAVLIVLLFPFKEQTYWHVVQQFAADRQHCDPDRPYRLVADLCHAEGIPVLDLTDTFRARARQGDVLYLRDDAHWNEAGNALAGRAIAGFLHAQGLAVAR
jgi:SGNH hydrolase-like domain, acetyltransferase AlgX